jgi:hypothetical protein
MNVMSMMGVDLFTLGNFEKTLQLVRLGNPRPEDVSTCAVLGMKPITLKRVRVIGFLFYSFSPECFISTIRGREATGSPYVYGSNFTASAMTY